MGLIDQLLALHQVDSQVRGLRTRVDSAERYLKVQERTLVVVTTEQSEVQLRSRQLEASIANLEVEKTTLDERIAKLRADLNASTTSKQYTAIQTEMKSLKDKGDEVDTQALELMEQCEQERTALAEVDQRLAERNTIRIRAEQECEQRRQDVGDRLTELERERDLAASQLPDRTLILFDRVADLTEGETLAEIREVNRKHREYVCNECSRELPFDAVVRLTNSEDDVVQCTGCQRILHLDPSLRGALSK